MKPQSKQQGPEIAPLNSIKGFRHISLYSHIFCSNLWFCL
ncbi:unnamed protein product [Arabidopsis halleri]